MSRSYLFLLPAEETESILCRDQILADLVKAGNQFLAEWERGPQWVSADTADQFARATQRAELLEACGS